MGEGLLEGTERRVRLSVRLAKPFPCSQEAHFAYDIATCGTDASLLIRTRLYAVATM